MSQCDPCGLAKPRWSVAAQVASSPTSSAGLPNPSAIVGVGPPWSCSGPSSGFLPCWSLASVNSQLESLSRLWPADVTFGPNGSVQSPPALPATIVFETVTTSLRESPFLWLAAIVTLFRLMPQQLFTSPLPL